MRINHIMHIVLLYKFINHISMLHIKHDEIWQRYTEQLKLKPVPGSPGFEKLSDNKLLITLPPIS